MCVCVCVCMDAVIILPTSDHTQAIKFCTHYGLTVTRKPSIVLQRGGLTPPEEPLPLMRSPHLVEGKSDRCLGEVVYGSLLPPPPTLPPPYCSFTRLVETGDVREPHPPPPYVPNYTEEVCGFIESD